MANNSKFTNLRIKPREKFRLFGADSMDDFEYLSIILQTGSKTQSVNVLSASLIEKYGSLKEVIDQPINELMENNGIGEVKALKIKSIYYIMESIKKENKVDKKIKTPKDIYDVVKIYENNKEENFYIVALSKNNTFLGVRHLFKGGIDSIGISLREIFKEALLLNSKSICIIHNHPSGNLVPSVEDIKTTQKIIEASKIVQVQIIDHIIIGKSGYFSLKEKELIEFY